jgi:hypothetical protein
MKTTFLNFLQHFQEHLTSAEAAKILTEKIDVIKIKHANDFFLLKAYDLIDDLRTSLPTVTPLHRLKEIFKGFPVESAASPPAYDAAALAVLSAKLPIILTASENIILSEIHTAKESKIEAEKISEKINNEHDKFLWLRELIYLACDELFDGAGMVKPEILSILGLESLLESWQAHHGQRSLDLRSSLVTSYVLFILAPALHATWNASQELNSNFIPELLQKLKSLDEIFDRYSVYGKPLPESCAMIFANMKEEKILAIMREDLQSLHQQKFDNMPKHLRSDWYSNKFNFWNEIIILLGNQHEIIHASDKAKAQRVSPQVYEEIELEFKKCTQRFPNLVSHPAIKAGLTSAFQNKIRYRSNVYPLATQSMQVARTKKIAGMQQVLNNARAERGFHTIFYFFKRPNAQVQPIPRNAIFNETDLAKWFTVRDNFMVIQSILRHAAEGFATATTDLERRIILQLGEKRFNCYLVTEETRFLLGSSISDCKSTRLLRILNSYKLVFNNYSQREPRLSHEPAKINELQELRQHTPTR